MLQPEVGMASRTSPESLGGLPYPPLTVLAAALACACGPLSDLGSLPAPELVLFEESLARRDANAFQVEIHFGGNRCAEIGSSLRGTANDQPLNVTERGGIDAQGDTCLPLRLSGRLSGLESGPVVIRVRDDSHAIEAELPHLFEARRLEVVSPAGPLHVGDEVELRWQPDTDTLKNARTGERLGPVTLSGGIGNGFYAGGIVSGSRIGFTVPESAFAPPEGEGRLALSDANIEVPAARCEGARSCNGRLSWERTNGASAVVSFVNRRRP